MLDLLATAKEQAEHTNFPVRAAALLRIARVEMAGDPRGARSTFKRGLDAIGTLGGIEHEFLLEQSSLLAAAVSPDLLVPNLSLRPPSGFESRVFEIMLDHGHKDEAALYLCHVIEEHPTRLYPVMLSNMATEVRLALLRRAFALWQNSLPREGSLELESGFIQLFQSQWRLLTREEAVAVVRQIVRAFSDRPDHPTSIGWNGVMFTSRRAYALFLLLPALKSLDPDLAESLVAMDAELASAALRYPNGVERMDTESGIVNTPRHRREEKPLDSRLCEADFAPTFDGAQLKYGQDSDQQNPNLAPKEVWPSTACFRNIMYEAGTRLGRNAEALLERVPDPELRLFAQVELAAALTGMPKFRETERTCWKLVSF